EVISSPTGNGNNGVVGMLLRLLLKSDEESVASFHYITSASPKSRMSPSTLMILGGLMQAMKRRFAHSRKAWSVRRA
ncbi:MAG TPA: hypothetical protein VKV20_07480, partial [Ktedonobacteraceae bacterium]|nr:hypothetical protein [Ktedonobacteraceae bacterium]